MKSRRQERNPRYGLVFYSAGWVGIKGVTHGLGQDFKGFIQGCAPHPWVLRFSGFVVKV